MTRWLQLALLVIGGLVLLALVAGQLGLLAGAAPTSLGVHDGRLAPPAPTPNSVSSQADLYPDNPQQKFAQIAPLPFVGNGEAAMTKLVSVIRQMPRTKIVIEQPDYIRAEFQSRLMHYTDDLELWLDRDKGVIQVRSASRMGESDLGVNRERVETLRTLSTR
ncbi:MAG: DUF1499 domain-containing protein [Burkholderiaceae bacterium]